MKGRDHSRRSEMASVVIPRETGIAEMTPEEWRWRAAVARSEPKEGEFGKYLRELGLLDWQAPSPYGAFANLMGVTDDTVRKWIETNNPPRHARAYVQLALVLKAAQKFIPSPVSPKAEKPVTPIAPAMDRNPLPVVDKAHAHRPETTALLPKMPLPEHLRRR